MDDMEKDDNSSKLSVNSYESININIPQARKEIDKDQKKQEKTAKSSEAQPPNQEEDRSGKNKKADQEQIKLQNDAEEKLRLVKNLIENARQAMVYDHYSSAETLLNQALSLLGSNPILRGSALEKKVNSIRSEAIEVQSGYDSSTFKASMGASAAFPSCFRI